MLCKGVRVQRFNRQYRSKQRCVRHLNSLRVVEDRMKYLSPSLSTFQAFKTPFIPVTAKMQYIYDRSGRKYLDLLAQNLTISVGHAHPKVMRAVTDNFKTGMVHCTTMYYNSKPGEVAKKLVDTLPELENDEWVVHFVNSGSEAVDLAMLMARSYTGSKDILALRNGYHGLHGPAMGVTGLSVCKNKFQLDNGVKHVMNPNMYNGLLSNSSISKKDQIDLYANDVADTIKYETPGTVAGLIFEQVQGYGGIHVLPKGYMPQVAKYIQDAGGVIIADEVQSGFGRMGRNTFWSYEMYNQLQDFTPDIVVTAKGLGNGFPIAAVMVKRKIADSITHHQFFNTYGGNPTVCTAASVVLDIVKTQKHLKTVDNLGKKISTVLRKLKTDYPGIIGDVRGSGLMYGVEFIDPIIAGKMFEDLRNEGLIFGLGGINKNVIRVMPPMCINRDNIRSIDVALRKLLASARK